MTKFKKTLRWLSLYDGVWSVPFAFLGFWLVGLLLQFLDVSAGSYDIAFVQPLFLAIAVVIGATNAAVGGMWFTFRGLFRFFYGYTDDNGQYVNKSKEEFQKLQPWQKFAFSFGVFYFYVWAVVSVYLKMI